jgi:hypothetical protein
MSLVEFSPEVVYLYFDEVFFKFPLKEEIVNEATRKKIEQRAYEIYLKRGGKPGDPKSDWDQAEKEIMAELKPVIKEAPAAKPAPAPAAAKPAQPFQAKRPQQQKRK